MKKLYLFLILIASLSVNGQTECDDANYYLVSAYSHVKSSYDANNISHLKYNAKRSVESLKLSKEPLTICGCETAIALADKAMILLAKVEAAKTYEDGRFFVKQGRDISKESVIAIEKCTTVTSTESTTNSQALGDLEKEQLKLKEQQEALKLKADEIKIKLAEQKEKELQLKKETLILNYKSAISSNIKTYNETLKSCNCNGESIKDVESLEDTDSKSMEDIRIYYINNLKTLASSYLSQLNLCK
ncbi:hypothetical protein QLS71_011360 [Mariniflexile litorale]|uniref:DUF4398 domain-containing protein n=1 Tax=Mariniflexile litorale TaxID=3045158 RepID=A0AAU7EA36_9FLAO|nr:hypothetical protein [Mariniflexile sp. KMM 9835]MDQ8212947.1 hypothetical protein [Mariniflexile sp. KMM 9835]